MIFVLFISLVVFDRVNCQNGNVDSRILFKDEELPCLDEGKNGTCVSGHQCLSVVSKLRSRKRPTVCGYQGTDAKVCCTDCNLVTNISNLVVSSISGYLWKDGQKAWDKCLEYIDKLVFECADTYSYFLRLDWQKEKQCTNANFQQIRQFASYSGQPAKRNEYPHMALLGYGDDQATAQWLCGGSVISDKFILTAAHCISARGLGPVKFAALGILQRSDPIELWQVYNIGRIVPHPQYKSPVKYHDIALLETEKKIQFNKFVMPACLHIEGRVGGGEKALATGWGALGHRQTVADVLQVGDSGGPLQFRNSSLHCVFIVAGVTSYGVTCGFAGSAGMYTRVAHYVPWVESVVWP